MFFFCKIKNICYLFEKWNMKAFHFLVKNTKGDTEWQKGHIEFPVKVVVVWAPAFIAASPSQTVKP